MNSFSVLDDKIVDKSAICGIIGLGYVGLPLSMVLCDAGFVIKGYDVSKAKVKLLNSGYSDVDDVHSEKVKKHLQAGRFSATTDSSVLKDVDIAIICVPTPLSRFKDPDMSYVNDAVKKIIANIHSEMLVILESTTYPGTTEDLIAQPIEQKGFIIGKDIFVAFSPERVDPGNIRWHTGNTPKVVGGMTEKCTRIAVDFYSSFLEQVVPVSSTAAAEMVKLLENTFRSVNIALVNEMAMICDKLGLDVWEITKAAATKPFGFMQFNPGPGVGGHCIPIDPHYLSWKLKSLNFYAHFIELAGEVNYNMPNYVLEGIMRHMNNHSRVLNDADVLFLGVAYKKDISDVRESPVLDLIKLVLDYGANVIYNDPYVPKLRMGNDYIQSVELSEELLENMDLVVITTDHSMYDYKWLAEHSRLIFDTRNAMHDILDYDDKIARLGVNKR
jgi:UDP-N-acetyl-D-glucosamine dehydrogenase